MTLCEGTAALFEVVSYGLVLVSIGWFGFETCAEGCFDPVGRGDGPPCFSLDCVEVSLLLLCTALHYETSIEGLGTIFVCLLPPKQPPV